MKKHVYLLTLVISLFLGGCATNLTATLAPGANLDDLGKTAVVRFDPDKRNLNWVIADQLTAMGYPAVAVEKENLPDDVKTIVTYEDKWQWDLTNYMINIHIEFMDGKSGNLIVSGESYRTSLARKSPEEMIRETLQEILKKKKT